MKRSSGRILTTHVGSLPRPQDLAGMIASTNCGFGTFLYLTVPEDLAYAKLRTLAEGAAQTSKDLF